MSPRVREFAVVVSWFVATTAAAVAGGIVALLAWTRDPESAGLGSLAFLGVLPSILLYFVLDWWRPESRAKHFGFALPILVIAALLVANLVELSLGEDADGAGQWVEAMAVAIAGSSCGACVGLWLKQRLR